MILVNTDYISGKELEMLGLVKGSTIQSKHLGKDITSAFKGLVGGELKSYNEMMNEARAIATKRMVEEAEALGATNSHFVNAHGLHDDDHYTTAYDLYLIFQNALKNETFREICGSTSYNVSYKNN